MKSSVQSGFTLIELVTVIVILGILAATALPRLTSIDSAAKKAVVLGGLSALQTTATLSYATNRTYTTFAKILASTSISDPLFTMSTSAGVAGTNTCTHDLSSGPDSSIYAFYKDSSTSLILAGTLASVAIESALCSG